MAFLVVLAVFVALGVLALVAGVDSRPSAAARPEPQWPFYRHRS